MPLFWLLHSGNRLIVAVSQVYWALLHCIYSYCKLQIFRTSQGQVTRTKITAVWNYSPILSHQYLKILLQASNCLEYHNKFKIKKKKKKKRQKKHEAIRKSWPWIPSLQIVHQKEMTSGINDPCDWLPQITGCQFVFWRHLLCTAKDWCEKAHAVPRLNKSRFVSHLEKTERKRERKGGRRKAYHRWKYVLKGHTRVSLPQQMLLTS